MQIKRVLFVVVTLLALTPSLGNAQDRSVFVNLGGGPTFIGGDLGERFATGWGPAIGVTFHPPESRVGFQFEYAYRWFNIKDDVPILGGATRFSANHNTHQLDFNAVVNLVPAGSPIRPYVVAGPGMYYRSVEITEYVGTGIICDPFYYVCGSYAITDVIGSRGGWDFGFNVGGGVGFLLGESAEFYVESRYHYVAGPEILSATPLVTGSDDNKANGSYYPLTFGFRF